MGLQAGGRLGNYQVFALLGTGGMGEVYRARDTKLNREVALKVLPDAMARDPQRMARFEREARTLASLNHPHIAAIHGLEEANGQRALVMELVEGPTLAERIADAPIPLEDTISLALQIAEALAYAHDKGIIHRDLKPANIKVTPDGQVKILDFGLAKAMSLELSNSSADAVTMPVTTSAGLVLGTAAYMSPEQARGQEVDRRSDVWSFGVVMYEMLTGKRPFAGQTISDTLAAVLREAPDLEGVPPRMRRLVAACLEKDRRERLRDLGDVRLLVGIDSGEPGATAAAEALPKTTRQRRAVPWAVASLLFAVAIVFAVAYFRKSGKPQGVIRSMIAPPEGVTFAFGDSSGPVLSPDGTRLIFPAWDASGKEALWVRSLDSLTAQRLEGTEGASYPFWSPDSGHVGFFQAGKLKEIDVTGGPPVVLCDAPDARGGTWGRTNTILFASRPFGGLESVPATGGQPTPVSSPVGSEASFSNRWPEFLPDGKHFIFLSGDLSAAGTNKIGIYTGEIGSKESRFLLQADSDALYVPPGYLLFLRGDTLMAQRFDAESEKPEGEAFPLVQHVDSPALYRLGLFSASATGLLVYETAGVGPDSQMAWYTATGKQLAEVGPSGLSTRASPRTKNNSHT